MNSRREFLKSLGKFALALPFVSLLRLPDTDELLGDEGEVFKVEQGHFCSGGEGCSFVSFDKDGFTLNFSDTPKLDEIKYSSNPDDFPEREHPYWWERGDPPEIVLQ